MTNEVAECILSAMMTDTVMLKSPTTTDIDRKIATALGKKIGVDPVEFGKSVFKSRGAGDFTPEQMVSRDIKCFEISGKKIFIGQYETVDKSGALDQITSLRAAMEEYRKTNNGDALVLLVTDILEEGSQVLICGDDEIPCRGLGIENKSEGVWMPGILSRKKQVAAPLIACGE